MQTREDYDVSYNTDLASVPQSALSDRAFIASLLLDAVEQSLQIVPCPIHEMRKARDWLRGLYAQSLLLLLDINPKAAIERLQKKWAAVDERIAHGQLRVH